MRRILTLVLFLVARHAGERRRRQAGASGRVRLAPRRRPLDHRRDALPDEPQLHGPAHPRLPRERVPAHEAGGRGARARAEGRAGQGLHAQGLRLLPAAALGRRLRQVGQGPLGPEDEGRVLPARAQEPGVQGGLHRHPVRPQPRQHDGPHARQAPRGQAGALPPRRPPARLRRAAQQALPRQHDRHGHGLRLLRPARPPLRDALPRDEAAPQPATPPQADARRGLQAARHRVVALHARRTSPTRRPTSTSRWSECNVAEGEELATRLAGETPIQRRCRRAPWRSPRRRRRRPAAPAASSRCWRGRAPGSAPSRPAPRRARSRSSRRPARPGPTRSR